MMIVKHYLGGHAHDTFNLHITTFNSTQFLCLVSLRASTELLVLTDRVLETQRTCAFLYSLLFAHRSYPTNTSKQ